MKRWMKWLGLGIVCLVALTRPGLGWAKTHHFDKLFAHVGKHFGIPGLLLKAIAMQESDLHPLAINIAGKDYWPQNEEKALKLIRYAQRTHRNFDVGLMQINRWWLQKWALDPEVLLNPIDNVFCGAHILAGEIDRGGRTWKAIGHYHSHTPERAMNYAARIRKHVSRLLAG